jgi:hypothetical protein
MSFTRTGPGQLPPYVRERHGFGEQFPFSHDGKRLLFPGKARFFAEDGRQSPRPLRGDAFDPSFTNCDPTY